MEKNRKLFGILLAIAIGMFGFGFLLVPIYNSLCKALNINGKTNKEAIAYNPAGKIDYNREITVQFVATNNSMVPWAFFPSVNTIKMHPGEMKQLSFYAENKTDYTMSIQAIPSVTPGLAAKYLKKTECFCFTQQTLNGHEAMDMPLLFHIDADLPKNIKTITLSYTIFDITNRVTH